MIAASSPKAGPRSGVRTPAASADTAAWQRAVTASSSWCSTSVRSIRTAATGTRSTRAGKKMSSSVVWCLGSSAESPAQ